MDEGDNAVTQNGQGCVAESIGAVYFTVAMTHTWHMILDKPS
jgi:hypothetical protein